jgi:hypothetical protein
VQGFRDSSTMVIDRKEKNVEDDAANIGALATMLVIAGTQALTLPPSPRSFESEDRL